MRKRRKNGGDDWQWWVAGAAGVAGAFILWTRYKTSRGESWLFPAGGSSSTPNKTPAPPTNDQAAPKTQSAASLLARFALSVVVQTGDAGVFAVMGSTVPLPSNTNTLLFPLWYAAHAGGPIFFLPVTTDPPGTPDAFLYTSPAIPPSNSVLVR